MCVCVRARACVIDSKKLQSKQFSCDFSSFLNQISQDVFSSRGKLVAKTLLSRYYLSPNMYMVKL